MIDHTAPVLTRATSTDRGQASPPPFFTLCSLLYVDDVSCHPVNLKAGRRNPVDIYVACACLLARSAEAAGERFVLITNRADTVEKTAERLTLRPPELIQLDFQLDIPSHVPFYQAHFKLALMGALGQGVCGPAAVLLDLDMVVLKPFTHILNENCLTAYDITDQVSGEYVQSLTSLLGAPASRWYGGEFLAGPAASFTRLNDHVTEFTPAYVRGIHNFAHIGDETVVSAALNRMEERGVRLDDAGRSCMVARWWSSRTKHRQPAFAEVEDACVLHLPSDKPFLAKEALSSYDLAGLTDRYRSDIRYKIFARRAVQLLDTRQSRKTLYAARLT